MKIIFDSEEQKETFMGMIISSSSECPGFFGLNNLPKKQCFKENGCKICWEECGIEHEVKGAENQ